MEMIHAPDNGTECSTTIKEHDLVYLCDEPRSDIYINSLYLKVI